MKLTALAKTIIAKLLPTTVVQTIRQRLRDHRLPKEYTRANAADLPIRRQNQRLRVAWALAGNEWVASSRLKGVLLTRYAKDHDCGFDSLVAYMPNGSDFYLHWRRDFWKPFIGRADVLVVQTWTGATLDLLEDCRQAGVRVIFTLSDLEFDRVPPRIFELSNAVVVSAEILKEAGKLFHNNVVLIDDPIEVPPGCIRKPTQNGFNPELVWMGHHDHWPTVLWLKGLLDSPDFSSMKLRTVSRHPEATHPWFPNTYWRDVSESDIAVIPCKLDPWAQGKSSNRLASFMTMGYPVIASPIRSYAKLITHGMNGFLATTEGEWRDCIRLLRDPTLRDRIGLAARNSPVLEETRIDRVAERWRSLFVSLL